MIKKEPIKKKDWDKVGLKSFIPKLSYVRFSDGRIDPRFDPYQRAKEFWPNEGIYKFKIVRG